MNIKIDRQEYQAFGWKIYKNTAPAGFTYSVGLAKAHTSSTTGMQTIWTKGLIVGVNSATNIATNIRSPGVFSGHFKNTFNPGRYIFKCIEDSEWWCLSDAANGGDRASVSPLILSEGMSVLLTENTNLLLLSGSINLSGTLISEAPSAITITSAVTTIIAKTDIIGLIFERHKHDV